MGIGASLTIDRPEQLKALGHPIRLRVLEALGDGEDLTNRELSNRLGIDPGHLHFHVRMLLAAGLIERVDGQGAREKPYRAVAAAIRVAPELLSTGAARDARGAMLDEVNRGYERYAADGNWRSAQIAVHIDPETLREAFRIFSDTLERLEDLDAEPLLVTVIAHPQLTGKPRARGSGRKQR